MFPIDTIKFKKNSDDLDDWFKMFKRAYKLKRLAGCSGAYAKLYESPIDTSIVFKIGDPKDDPYWLYVEQLSENNYRNPALPKIHHVIRLSGGWEDVYIVIMERLRPATREEKHQLDRLWKLLDFYSDGRIIPTYGVKLDRNIQRAITVVNQARLRKRGNHWFDFHDKNWMFRDDQVVLTDPLA